MAVTRRTLKDVGTYEAKFLGPFTARQSICLGVGAVPAALFDYLLYNVTKDATILFLVTVIFMAPAFFMAFGSKFCHDTKPEDFVKDYVKYKIMAPPIRLYATSSRDDEIWEEEEKKKKKTEEKEESPKKDKKYSKKVEDSTYKVGNRTFVKYQHKESKTIREAL